ASEHRAEARGVGLAELRRDRDRRRPAGEAGPEQRCRGRAGGAELVPDEVAPEADSGRRGTGEHGAVHQTTRAQEDEGDGQGMTPSGRRLLWSGVGASLAALAVTAIVAVVAGSFGDTFRRTIGTVVILFVCGATALAGSELVHRRQLRSVGWAALLVALACA